MNGSPSGHCGGPPPAGPPRGRLSRIDRHTIFREMVKGELRRGNLSKGRHLQLIRYAGSLNLNEAEARELIDEARHAFGLAAAPDAWTPSTTHSPAGVAIGRAWLATAAIVVALAVINLLIGHLR